MNVHSHGPAWSQKLAPGSSHLPSSQRSRARRACILLPVPQETSYTTSWWNSRIRREEDSLIAAAYKLLPFWHQWPQTVEKLAGLGEHAFWPRQGGRPAGCSITHTHAQHTHTLHPAVGVMARWLLCRVKGGRYQLVTLSVETERDKE